MALVGRFGLAQHVGIGQYTFAQTDHALAGVGLEI